VYFASPAVTAASTRLANGDAQAARAIRIGGEHLPAGVGFFGRAGDHLATPELHHRAANGFCW